MILELDRTQEALRSEIISFVQNEINPGVEQRVERQEFDRTLWQKCGAQGLAGLSIPERWGGRGLSVTSSMIALEALGYACEDNGFSFTLGAHFLATVVPIYLYGRDEQRKDFLPRLCDGTWLAANAMTENKSGSDTFTMKTFAEKVGSDYKLSGQKDFCSSAPIADLILTYALTNPKKGMFGGISSFILQKSKNHFTTGKKIEKMGLQTSLMSSVFYDTIGLTTDDLLGKEGGGSVIFTKSMVWERIGLSALHLGTLHRLLDKTIRMLKLRKKEAGKSKELEFQATTHQLAIISTEWAAARQLTFHAANLLEQKKSADLYASMAKLKSSELYKSAVIQLLQIQASLAIFNDRDTLRTFNDVSASTIYSGTSEIQKNIIARRLKI